MTNYQRRLKRAIREKYGSVEKWAEAYDVTPVRFYKFLKNEYNPTVRTLEAWLHSVDLELTVVKKKSK